MPATSSAAVNKAPKTDALLAIDALPVWRAQADPAAKTEARLTPPATIKTATPISEAVTTAAAAGAEPHARSKSAASAASADPPIADVKPAPKKTARSSPATPRPRTQSGAAVLCAGVLAGALLASPFVDWRGAARGGVSRAAGPQIASASAPTPAAAASALAIEASETIEPAPVLDVEASQHAAAIEADPAPIVEAAAEVFDDAQPIVVAFEEPAAPGDLRTERDIPAAPAAARLPAQGGDDAPAAARPRVVVHYNEDRRAAAAIAGRLKGRRAGRIELRRVNFAIRRPELRIFRPADAARAAALAGAVSPNATPPVRNFGHFRPLPAPGLIEVWAR